MEERRARVISQEKGSYRISSGADMKAAAVSGKYRYEAVTVSDYPAVGDYVLAQWPEDDAPAVIRSLFPRKSCFIRRAAGSAKQEQVVLTKADLCRDVDSRVSEVRGAAPGVDILVVSSLSGDLGAVTRYILPGRTVAFLGSSGVGRSTLINQLTGTHSFATGTVGAADKGRHTTTHRELITLSNGAFLIDTPGMRELGMWDSGGGIDAAFRDVEGLARTCRFSNCTHTSEPGCAIQQALANGTLDAARWRSFRKLKLEDRSAADNSRYQAAKRERARAGRKRHS